MGGASAWDLDWDLFFVFCVCTLNHSVGRLYRWEISDDRDVIISVWALHVNIDGLLHLTAQTGHHTSGICDVG